MSELAGLVVPDAKIPIDALPNGNARFESPDLLAWAKDQDIPPVYGCQGEMLGEMSIALLGEIARIGWMRADPQFGFRVLNGYPILRNERLTILEGDVTVKVKRMDGTIVPKSSSIQSYNLHRAQRAIFSNPTGPDGRCWYLFTPFLNRAPKQPDN